jgi:small subunit ribosomal protein S1
MSNKKSSLDELVTKKVKEEEDEKEKELKSFASFINSQDIPKIGDKIKGKVIEVSKNEIRVDLGIYGIGIIRGEELWETVDTYSDLKAGDEIEATILELHNEEGDIELTFRKATKKEIWDELIGKKDKRESIYVKVQGANKGGLLTKIYGISAFMPVSQLTPEHYPKVEGGDQHQILSLLQDFVGKKMKVNIITADLKEKKIIVSEKQAVLDKQKQKLNKLKVGDIVDGVITAVVDFGAFVKFKLPNMNDEFEGLIHISELSWKRVDNPEDIVKVAENIKAEIIGIDNNKITLSIKKLKKDPWQKAIKNYKVGQIVEGEVIKIEPFGAFIQLDKDIHGLLHVSEFSKKDKDGKRQDLRLGDKKEFKILSIEPEEHRLGLSIRALGEKEEDKSEKVDKKPKKSSKPEKKKEKDNKKDKVKPKDKSNKKEKSK